MATGTGLDKQVGAKLETTYGTAVTVDKFWEVSDIGLEKNIDFIDSSGIRVGQKIQRAARTVQSRSSVSGTLQLEHSSRLMGMWWKLALGSTVVTPTIIAAGPAHKQVHQLGDFVGKSATIQVGRPEPSGTVRAHTYAGCKVSGWEFSVSDNEMAMLSLDIEGRSEATATALATASFVAGAEIFNFSQVAAGFFKLGGTASTAAGEVSIASGVAVAPIVTGFTLKGETPMATERYGLGNAGLRAEPLENDIPMITGTIEAEWDRTTFYDLFAANTTTAIELKFEGSVIAGADKNTLSFIIPAAKFLAVPVSMDGADILTASVDFKVYSDEVNAPLQVKLISADSTAL